MLLLCVLALWSVVSSLPKGTVTCSSYCVHTKENAIFQAVYILHESQRLHKSPSLEDNADTTIQYCVPTEYAWGIRFRLVATGNHIWEGGSYITVFGTNGNIVQKSHYFEDQTNEFVISLLNTIEKGSQWKSFLSLNVDPSWMQPIFDDSHWNNYWYNASSQVTSTHPVYFRVTFLVDPLYIAYEVQIQYQFGVLVYMNGNEVFRDNMSETTMDCSHFYPSLDYHGFIRSASDFRSVNTLAVVHYPYSHTPLMVFHDAFLAGYFSTLQSDCYVYPYEVVLSSASANPLLDMNLNTFWNAYTVSPSVQIRFPRVPVAVNTIELYSTARCDGLPDFVEFTEEFRSDRVFSLPVESFRPNAYRQVELPVEHKVLQGFTLRFSASSPISLPEMRLSVCRSSPLPSLRFAQSALSLFVGVPMEPLLPIPLVVKRCMLQYQLPSGLALTSSCRIEGIPSEVGVFVVYVVSQDPPLEPGRLEITVKNCFGTLLRLERRWSARFFRGDSVLIRDHAQELYREDPNSFQKALDSAVYYVCTNATKLEITMSHTEFLYWWYHSSLRIDWYSPEYAFPVFRSRYDSRVGSGMHQTLSLDCVANMNSYWYHWYGELASSWMDDAVDLWAFQSFPFWSCRDVSVNAFKRFFSVADTQGISALELHVSYGGGIVIFVNEVMVYSFNVDLPFTNRSQPKRWNPQTRFHTIVIPSYYNVRRENTSFLHYSVLKQGANTIAIAVVRFANETECPTFRCLLRLRGEEDADVAPLIEEVSGSEPNGSDVLQKEGDVEVTGSKFASKTFLIDFGSGREVSVNSLVATSKEIRKNALPSFVLSGQRDDDSEWHELLDVTPQTQLASKSSQQYWILQPNCYRKYRFTTRTNATAPWYLTSLVLRQEWIPIFLPKLTYPPVEVSVGQEFECIPPQSKWYGNFSLVSMYSRLSVDIENGCLFGAIDSEGSLIVKVTATSIENETYAFQHILNVRHPEPNTLFTSLRIVTGSSPLASNWTLYSGIPPSYLQRNCSFAELLRVATFHSSNTINYQPHSTYVHSIALSEYAHMIVFPDPSPWDPSAMFHVSYNDFLITSGGFNAESEKYVLFTTLFVVDRESTRWRLYDLENPVPSDWLSLSYDDSDWVQGPLAHYALPHPVVTTYSRIFFDWSPLTIYRLLQGKVYYEGGLKVFVNGRVVARFNLAEDATSSTYAVQQHDYAAPSRFHISMLLDNCLTGRNLLAFEIHQPPGSTAVNATLRFDCMMRAVFSKLAYATDSVTDIRSTLIPSERNPLAFALSDDYTLFGYAVIEYKSFIEWSPENLEKSRINTFLIASGGIDKISLSLFGTMDGVQWDEVLSLSRLSLAASRRIPFPLLQGIRGYARYRVEFNCETVRQDILRINVVAFGLMETDGPACPAVNEFPATFNNNISPGACPAGYVGYAYRRCVDGRLGSVMLDRCVEKKPSVFYYPAGTLWVGGPIEWTPVVDRKQVQFELLDPLPQGLAFNRSSGVVSGLVMQETNTTVRVHVRNSQGVKGTILRLVVRHATCRRDGSWEEVTVVNQVTVTIICPNNQMMGIQTRSCFQKDRGGEWGDIHSRCISRRLLCALLIVASLVLSLGVLLLRNLLIHSRKRPELSSVTVIMMQESGD